MYKIIHQNGSVVVFPRNCPSSVRYFDINFCVFLNLLDRALHDQQISGFLGSAAGKCVLLRYWCLALAFIIYVNYYNELQGFEARGTMLAQRLTAWHNLIEKTHPRGELVDNPLEYYHYLQHIIQKVKLFILVVWKAMHLKNLLYFFFHLFIFQCDKLFTVIIIIIQSVGQRMAYVYNYFDVCITYPHSTIPSLNVRKVPLEHLGNVPGVKKISRFF